MISAHDSAERTGIALDIDLDKLGPEHVDVATSYNNLALIYKDLGDFEQAKEYRQRALAIDVKPCKQSVAARLQSKILLGV